MGRILIEGEYGNGFVDELTPLPNVRMRLNPTAIPNKRSTLKEVVVAKPGKGAFCNTQLDSILKDVLHVSHLIITGVTTEVCCQTTMREANDRGYECLIVEDATESYFPEFKKATLDMIAAQGAIVGWVGMAEHVIETLEAHAAARPKSV